MDDDSVAIETHYKLSQIIVIEVTIRNHILQLDEIEGTLQIRQDLQQCRKALLSLVGLEDDWTRNDEHQTE